MKHACHKPILVSVVAVTLLSLGSARAQQPFFMGLGDLPGGPYLSGIPFHHAISYDGTVVVGYSSSYGSERSGHNEEFRWSPNTGMVGLGVQGTIVVSGDGTTIVGSDWVTQVNYRWTAETGVVPLPLGFFADDVSGDGSIVLGRYNTPTGVQRAALWTERGGIQLLPFDENLKPYSISDDGATILGYRSAPEFFLWNALDGVTWPDLPQLYGGNINNMSDNGKVVTANASPYADRRGLRWTKETGAVELGHLPDGRQMSANGVSADGSIIVGASQGLPEIQKQPAIWDAIDGPRYLANVLQGLGLGNTIAGWNLNIAWGVSGDGRSVIGAGINPDGNTEAWIAYLGPPAALAGDYNHDGSIDAADYVVWRNSLGQTGAGLAADGDASGTVDDADYTVWRAHFGQTAASGSGATAGSPSSATPAVPEPEAVVLLVIATVGLLVVPNQRFPNKRRSRNCAVDGSINSRRGLSDGIQYRPYLLHDLRR